MALIHGGDWAGYEEKYGRLPLDFSASISPLGLPESVRRAVIQALDAADHYPDPLCRKLRAALARYHGFPADGIVCGNGAADLIYRICRTLRPKKAAVLAPSFAEYALALEETGCEITYVYLSEKDNFRLTGIFDIPKDCELLFLCNPNNPTGVMTDPDILQALLLRCRETGMYLAVDECFLDFCQRPEAFSVIPELRTFPELIVLKAFTKTWAMAGLRLGYALCGDFALAEKLQDCGQPWAVSGIAQAAGMAALNDTDYVNHMRSLISSERKRVFDALSDLGLRVIPGEANFLLFFSEDTEIDRKLREYGILIRSCSNYPGLQKGWFRIAVRKTGENAALLAALEEARNHG